LVVSTEVSLSTGTNGLRGMYLDFLWIFLAGALGMWPSHFIFTLVLFRQKIKANTRKIILGSIVMAHITVILQSFSIQFAITILQPVAFILCLYFFFRTRLFYSILMSVIPFMIAIVEENTLYMLMSKFNWEIFVEVSQQYVILPALVLTFVNSIFALLLYKLRLGFSLVPVIHEHDDWNDSSRKKMNIILSIAIMVISCMCLSLYLWEQWLPLNLVLVCSLLIYSVRALYKKEIND
jgi:hypothetical protein